jgi:16S rRNA (guanine1516-N2)-methyltransferase
MPTRWDVPEVTLAPTGEARDLANAARFRIRVAPRRDEQAWQLVRSATGVMELCSPSGPNELRLDLDLMSGPLARRLRTTRNSDPLPRACGLVRTREPLTIVDAMAGLCRDAMVLASLGCSVTAIERVPALAFLAHDVIETSPLAARLTVHAGDAESWLAQRSSGTSPHVVYLDPMFADAGRAQVKKDMQVCRALAGPEHDTAALLPAARALATQRVVVKRRHDLPPLAAGVAFSVDGERVRFDVYLTPR